LESEQNIYIDLLLKFGNYALSLLIGVAWFGIRRWLKTIDCKFKKLEKKVDEEKSDRKELIQEIKTNVRSTDIDYRESFKVLENQVNSNSTKIARVEEQSKAMKEICKSKHGD